MPKRQMPAPLIGLLEVIAEHQTRRISLKELELRMHQRGFDSMMYAHAIGALERRGWASRFSGHLELTDWGYEAAMHGAKPRPLQRTVMSNRVKQTRMPRGMFG
jgi:hypothetical protein